MFGFMRYPLVSNNRSVCLVVTEFANIKGFIQHFENAHSCNTCYRMCLGWCKEDSLAPPSGDFRHDLEFQNENISPSTVACSFSIYSKH